MIETKANNKLLPLEALRGSAALVVVLHHFLLGFCPTVVGILTGVDKSHSLLGTPLFVFINAKAAVIVFFVLSGYVLSLRGLRPDAYRAIADGVLKRWFRLFPIVTLSVLLSYLLFKLEWFHFQDAAKLSLSPWMNTFAYGRLPQNFSPDLFQALRQGSIRTFFFAESAYNTNLWTMNWEMWGSLLTFSLALLLRGKLRWIMWALLLVLGFILFRGLPLLVPFLVGVAATGLEIHKWKFNWQITLGFLLLGIYLCGYYSPVLAYSWVDFFGYDEGHSQALVLSVGSLLILIGLASINPISAKLNGRWSKLLGQISFPIYLVHSLVIMSAGAWAYVVCEGGVGGTAMAAFATIAVTGLLTWLFTLFDLWWVRQLARVKI